MQSFEPQQFSKPTNVAGSFAGKLCASLNIQVPELAGPAPIVEQRPQQAAALEKALICPEARLLLETHKLDIEKKIAAAVLFMEPSLRHHLRCIPDNLQLVWTVMTPAKLDERKESYKRFYRHKKKFISWIGDKILNADSDLVVTASMSNSWNGQDTKTFSLTRADFVNMGDGVLPEDWSVEHIQPRSFSAAEGSNRIGNLQIMPTAVNAWTDRLMSLQRTIKILSGQLALVAKPDPGPEQGHLIYGASRPIIDDPNEIAQMQGLKIASLPSSEASRSGQMRQPCVQLEGYP